MRKSKTIASSVGEDDVVKRFIDVILENSGEIVLLAWYGSGFDHQLILGELKSRGGEDEVYIKDNHILYARIDFNNLVVHLKDPYRFIPKKLADAAISFDVIRKDSFPHIFKVGDLDKIYENWFILKSEVVTKSIGEHDKTKLVSLNYVKEFINGNNNDTVLQKAIQYCTIDVKCCRQIWAKFKRRIIHEEFRISIGPKLMTLPQLSMSLIRALMPSHIELCIPSKEHYEDFARALYGGRVVATKGIYGPSVVLDVVSEYPTVMNEYDHPYGPYRSVKDINWRKLGIYNVILEGPPSNDTNFIPFRNEFDNSVSYNPVEEHEAWYCTYDLLTAKEDGYKISVIEGYEWESKGRVFSNFIEKAKVLKESNNLVIKAIGKMLLNSGYGKMSQKPIDEEVYIVKKGITQQFIEKNKPT